MRYKTECFEHHGLSYEVKVKHTLIVPLKTSIFERQTSVSGKLLGRRFGYFSANCQSSVCESLYVDIYFLGNEHKNKSWNGLPDKFFAVREIKVQFGRKGLDSTQSHSESSIYEQAKAFWGENHLWDSGGTAAAVVTKNSTFFVITCDIFKCLPATARDVW